VEPSNKIWCGKSEQKLNSKGITRALGAEGKRRNQAPKTKSRKEPWDEHKPDECCLGASGPQLAYPQARNPNPTVQNLLAGQRCGLEGSYWVLLLRQSNFGRKSKVGSKVGRKEETPDRHAPRARSNFAANHTRPRGGGGGFCLKLPFTLRQATPPRGDSVLGGWETSCHRHSICKGGGLRHGLVSFPGSGVEGEA